VRAVGDVEISASDVEAVRFAQADGRTVDRLRFCRIGNIENLHAFRVGDETVIPLDGGLAGIAQEGTGIAAGHHGVFRIFHIHHRQALCGRDVEPLPRHP